MRKPRTFSSGKKYTPVFGSRAPYFFLSASYIATVALVWLFYWVFIDWLGVYFFSSIGGNEVYCLC